MPLLRPAFAYAATVFAAGTVLGAIRVLLLAPRLGETGAVLVELPVMLALSWVVAGRVLRHWPLPDRAARAVMGALALVLLLTAEIALALWGFGRPIGAVLAGFTTPSGVLGLAGQAAFAAFPALRR